MIQMIRNFALVFALIAFSVPSLAGSVYTPQRGDPLRKELLDTIRPRVQSDLNQRVLFVVETMNVEGNWAFLAVTPQRPNGQKIDIYSTHYAENADLMDGLTNYSLLKFANGRWNEITFVVGPTDVAYEPWPAQYGFSRELIQSR